jgi:hypothetical protein
LSNIANIFIFMILDDFCLLWWLFCNPSIHYAQYCWAGETSSVLRFVFRTRVVDSKPLADHELPRRFTKRSHGPAYGLHPPTTLRRLWGVLSGARQYIRKLCTSQETQYNSNTQPNRLIWLKGTAGIYCPSRKSNPPPHGQGSISPLFFSI